MKTNANRFFTRCAVFAALLMCLFACCAMAGAEEVYTDHAELLRDGFLPAKQPMDIIVLRGESFEEFMISQFEARATEFSALNYELTPDEFRQAYTDVLDKHPELFYAPNSWSYTTSGDYVATVWVEYTLTEAEIASKTAAFNASVQEVVRYAAQADTTLGKIMMVHDYLCASYEYDTTLVIHSAEEMFRLGTGVCQAYLQCFQAVMNELGIACEPVTSESMNHGWNMVQLDGSWYHLDATWDDPTSDMPLRARHQYFLLSNAGIEANEHTGWTCAQSATSTKYDSFFWANVNNPIPVVGDAMYYAEMNTTDYTRTLKKWDMSANTTTDVHTYSIASAAGRIRYVNGYNPMAASDSHLYYATVDKVYGLPIEGGTPELMHTFTGDECVWLSWFDGADVQVFASADINTATEPVKLQDLGYVSPYTYTDNGGGTCTITGYTGSDTDLVIPSVIDGLKVTRIGYNTFYSNEDITSVVIPEGVRQIDYYAFSYTENLKSVTLPSTLHTIWGGAFVRCTSLSELTIPAATTSLINNPFWGLPAEIKVEEGNTAYTVKDGVLYTSDFSRLISCPTTRTGTVAIPDETTKITEYAFYDCASLTEVVVPDGVTSIEKRAFNGCASLSSVNIPDNATALADYIFSGCESLTEIVIPDGVTTIGGSAFSGCAALENIDLPDGLTTIGSSAFSYCDALTRISIPEGVTAIENWTFTSCDNLTTVNLPSGLLTIGNEVFRWCPALETITLPSGITSIGSNAFNEAVIYCEANSTTAQTLTAAGYSYQPLLVSPFTYTDNGDGTCTITGYTGTDTELVIPSSIRGLTVTAIGEGAFVDLANITSVTLPDGILSLGMNAFDADTILLSNAGSTTATTVTAAGWSFQSPENSDYTLWQYPDDYDEAYLMVIYNGSLTTDITVPERIQEVRIKGLQTNAFNAGEEAVTITLPNMLMYIEPTAFDLCPNATLECNVGSVTGNVLSVYERPFAVPGVADFRFSQRTDSTAGTYRLLLTVEAYVGSAADVTVPAQVQNTDVVTIGDYAFHNNRTITSVIIPEGVTTLEQDAFNGCTALSQVTLPQSLTFLGANAFNGCSSLTALEIPESVTFIGEEAFRNCSGIVSLDLPDGVANLYYNTFDGCTSLESISLPQNLTWMDSAVFQHCESLKSVVLPEGLTRIGNHAFNYCTSLETINLPDGLTSIGSSAFSGCTNLTATVNYNSYAHNWCVENGVNVNVLGDPAADYTYIDCGDGTCIITGYTGEETELVIPAELDGLKVTAIGWNAFISKTELISVIIPEGVTTICMQAFWTCESLQNVSLPSTLERIDNFAFGCCSRLNELNIPAATTEIGWAFLCQPTMITVDSANTAYTAVDGVLYTADRKTLKFCPNVKTGVFAIPEGTETIDGRAFCGCYNITEIHIPASVTDVFHTMGFANGFAAMQGLEKFVVDEGNTAFKVENQALVTMDSSIFIALPGTVSGAYTVADGVEIIHSYAMCWNQITDVILPEGVTTIRERAFSDLPLETINLPLSLTDIHDKAFENCGDFTATVYDGSVAHTWCVENGITVNVLPDPATLYTYTDNGDGTCTITGYTGDATELVIPATIDGLKVTAIGVHAFAWNAQITSVVIPEGVTSVGIAAFEGCNSLQSVSLPSTLESIGQYAFTGCRNLSDVTIPAATTSIGEAAFACMATVVNVESGNTAFQTVDDVLYTIDGKTLMFCPRFKTDVFEIPEGTERIAEMAFWNTNITEIHIPASVTQIAHDSFDETNSLECFVVDDANVSFSYVDGMLLTSDGTELCCVPRTFDGTLVVPEGVKNIRYKAVSNANITNVVLPEGVTTIESRAFLTANLETINLPASIASIGDSAFTGCPDVIATVVDGSYAHNWCVENGITVNVLPDPATFYTYTDNGDGTCTITGYTGEETELVIPAELDGLKVTAIGERAVYNNDQITSVVIPEGVTSIGGNAFFQCYSLSNVSLPSTLERIDDFAFCWCSSLNELNIPAATTEIGLSFFGQPTMITVDSANTAYTAVDGVLYTADRKMLKFCPNVKTGVFAIPEGTEAIDGRAFCGCHNITEIHIPASVTDVSHTTSLDNGFGYMLGLEKFVVDEGNTAFKVENQALVTIDSSIFIALPGTVSGAYTVADGVEIIHSLAMDSNQITDVILPEGVTTIREWAFYNLPLETISLPQSLTRIHNYAFENCGDFTATVYDGSVAHAWCVENGITVNVLPDPATLYTYTDNGDGTCTITGYTGDATELVIPATIDGLKVTAIGEEAFVDLVDITSVTLPEGLETIGVMAFGYCEKLTAIHVPASVTSIQHHAFSPYSGIQNITVDENNPNYASVDGVLFSKDLSTLLRYPAARPNDSYTVPAGTTVIGNWAFNMSQSLRQVILPEGVTTLSDCAFGYAVGLELVNLPASISFIDPDAFFGCGNVMCQVEPNSYAHLWCHLNDVETDQAAIPFEIADNGDGTCTIVRCLSKAEHVDVPATICGLKVIALGEESFMDRTNMVSISLPEGLEVIGSWAFEMAENLRTIHIPSTVREIGTNAFAHYSGLTSITVEPGSAYFTSVDGVLFTADMSTLVRYPASKVGYSYTAPEGVTTVQERAFNGSALLNEIYLPDSVTTIGERAFDNCVSLMYVSLPGNISFIGEGALANCGNVTAGVVEGSYAHQWCIDNEIWWTLLETRYGDYVYSDNGDGTCTITRYTGDETELVIPATLNGLKVTRIEMGSSEFTFPSALTSVTLPEGLEYIGALAFSYCENLTEITVPASVTHVAARAFSPYSGVQNIYVADGSQSYASVDGVLFTKDMSKLVRYPAARTAESYTVPAGVKVIGSEAMTLSYALDTIVLPEGVTTIDQDAFAYCVSLDSINLPASITSIADYAFDNCGNVVATVVDGSYAHNWCVENDVVVNVLPDPATLYTYTDNGDGTCTITGYTGDATELVIPATIDGLKVTAIGRKAFYDNDQLTSVVIPEGVTSIGMVAFWSCRSLQNVSLPSTLESIGECAFTFCLKLAELTIPAATTSIGEAAFACMPTVMTVENGNTAYKMVDDVLYTIDGKTLLFCPRFKTGVFEVPEGTERIGEIAFWGTDVTEIHLPASVMCIGSEAFGETYFMERFVVDDASQHFADVEGMLLTKDGTELYRVPQTFSGTLTVPDGVKVIKYGAVRNYNITNVVLPEGLTTLENEAFLNLPLETINLPLSLTDIWNNSIANCGDFTATVYDGSVAHIWCVENGITVNVLENPYPGMIIPMDMSRLEVGPTVPTGLPFTVQTTDGSLQITYDGENANWDDVATYAYLEENKVSQPVRIEVASVNAAEVRLICGQWETDEEILTALDAAEAYELVDDTLYHWISYAEVDTANGTVTPISTDCTVAIQYRNTDGTVLYNEKFDLDVSCTTQGTFPATVNWIDMTTATPNYHGLEGITSRVEGNTLIYTLPAGFRELVATAFPVPEGTEGFSLDHLWMTGLWELRDGMARWAYNLDVLPVTYETSVAFYDANGSFLGGGRVRVRFEEEQAVQMVAADRINLCTQPGLILAERTLADGQVSLTIDSAATDWTAVVSYSTGLRDLGLSFEVSTPNGAVSCKTLNDSYETDEEILAAFERVPNTSHVDEMRGATLGACIGWYDHPDNVIITPAEVSQISAVQWLDENGNILATEKLNVAIRHTSMAEIPAERIVLDPSTALPNAWGHAGVTSRVMDNTLVYTVPEDWDGCTIVTDIPAPEGAAYYNMSDYRFNPDWIAVENGYVRHGLYTGPNAQEAFTVAIAWLDENGTLLGGGHFQLRWQVEGTVSVQPVPVSRIRMDSIPYGMDMSLAVVDGDIYAYIDDEATDWNKVATFNEPLYLHNPSTGESWYATDKVNFGFSIDAPEGAKYGYSSPGYWASDEELVAYMESCELWDASTTGPGWWNEIVTFEDGQATTIPLNSTNSVTTYAVRWADENGETILMEKVEVCYEHSNPYANYPASPIQIPAEDILPNVTGAENVTCTVEEGHVTHTFSSTDVNLRTYVTAPEGAVTYTVSSNGYDPDMMRIALVDGCYAPYGLSSWNEDETTTSTSRLLCWYDQQNRLIGGGWITYTFVYEPQGAVRLVSADRIEMEAIPYGMAMDLSVTDGNIYAYIDDEATDWNKVLTFNDPLHLYDPSTGESWYATDKVYFGFIFDNPEGAAYSKSVVGNVWESDEEILSALRTTTDISDLTTSGHGWWYEIAIYDAENEQFELQEIVGGNPHNYTYAVLWLDENQNELYAEKIEVCYDHSNPDVSYPASLIQIPAEDILPNTTGVSYADYTVSDGLLELTFTNRWPDIFTLVEAPEGTASYSMCDEGFDPDAERYELVEGRYVGYELSGWPEGQTESSYKTLHCWYDAEGNLIGGGWCTFHYTKAEAQLPAFKLPAAMRQIEAEAFLNASVQNVILPDGCESIGDRAFAGCNLLQEITIPASVTSIADDAFDGCDEMTITAEDGSYAEIYAEEHGIACFTR